MLLIITQSELWCFRVAVSKKSVQYGIIGSYHWMEECQHATLDELEWRREDRRLSKSEREAAVDELIEADDLTTMGEKPETRPSQRRCL